MEGELRRLLVMTPDTITGYYLTHLIWRRFEATRREVRWDALVVN